MAPAGVISDLVGGADDDFGDGPATGTGDDVLDGFGDVVGVQLFDAGEAGGHAFLDGRLLVADQFGLRKAALNLIERTFAAAHGYATLWRSGLCTDRKATVHDVASEAAAVARTLAEARRNV